MEGDYENEIFSAVLTHLLVSTEDLRESSTFFQELESPTGHSEPESSLYVNQIPTPEYENVWIGFNTEKINQIKLNQIH